MNVEILQLVEGARKAQGLAVVIDVFRAFSLEPYLFSRGAVAIHPVGDISEAYRLKQDNPSFLLVGERNERMPEGFDFGNSPHHCLQHKVAGKTIVHTTSAGTQGIVNAVNADEIITGSFVNAGAIVSYIRQRQPAHVSLCCMGYAAQCPSEEDTLCAEYIKASLEGGSPDFDAMVKIMRETAGSRFFIPENQWYAPQEDFYLCTKLSIFDFILKVSSQDGKRITSRVDIC